MPLITLDTSVALPAMLSPSGVPRKLLVLLAFGAARHRAEHLRLERDLLIDLAARQGGQVHGLDIFDAAIDEAERRRARLTELLPFSTPDTYVAAGFATLFDEHDASCARSATAWIRPFGKRTQPVCDASWRRSASPDPRRSIPRPPLL